MVSASATASASLSIRNHVLPPDASQTYLMLPPTWLPARIGNRAGGDAIPPAAKSGVGNESTASSGVCLHVPEASAARAREWRAARPAPSAPGRIGHLIERWIGRRPGAAR